MKVVVNMDILPTNCYSCNCYNKLCRDGGSELCCSLNGKEVSRTKPYIPTEDPECPIEKVIVPEEAISEIRHSIIGQFKVITICSSMRFKYEIEEAHKMLTLKGWIVLLPCPFYPTDTPDYPMTGEVGERFMEMHFQRINMSDAIFVINRDGYIGESVAREIKYAEDKNKEVLYYRPIS